jgi:hypothetical protein
VYIGDQLNQRIRKVTVSTGIISTFAGSGPAGFGMGSYSGDEGPATSAALNDPAAVFVDVSGNVYIADAWNQRIREVNTSCIISTIAGNGTEGFSGDGGAATNAEMILPEGVAVDGSGNVYIADEHNYRVREVCH